MTDSIRDNHLLRSDPQDVERATDIHRAAAANPPADDTDDIDDESTPTT